MAGIIASLEAGYYISPAYEQVHYLPLSLVAPLGAKNSN
jgi:hypothetical protein